MDNKNIQESLQLCMTTIKALSDHLLTIYTAIDDTNHGFSNSFQDNDSRTCSNYQNRHLSSKSKSHMYICEPCSESYYDDSVTYQCNCLSCTSDHQSCSVDKQSSIQDVLNFLLINKYLETSNLIPNSLEIPKIAPKCDAIKGDIDLNLINNKKNNDKVTIKSYDIKKKHKKKKSSSIQKSKKKKAISTSLSSDQSSIKSNKPKGKSISIFTETTKSSEVSTFNSNKSEENIKTKKINNNLVKNKKSHKIPRSNCPSQIITNIEEKKNEIIKNSDCVESKSCSDKPLQKELDHSNQVCSQSIQVNELTDILKLLVSEPNTLLNCLYNKYKDNNKSSSETSKCSIKKSKNDKIDKNEKAVQFESDECNQLASESNKHKVLISDGNIQVSKFSSSTEKQSQTENNKKDQNSEISLNTKLQNLDLYLNPIEGSVSSVSQTNYRFGSQPIHNDLSKGTSTLLNYNVKEHISGKSLNDDKSFTTNKTVKSSKKSDQQLNSHLSYQKQSTEEKSVQVVQQTKKDSDTKQTNTDDTRKYCDSFNVEQTSSDDKSIKLVNVEAISNRNKSICDNNKDIKNKSHSSKSDKCYNFSSDTAKNCCESFELKNTETPSQTKSNKNNIYQSYETMKTCETVSLEPLTNKSIDVKLSTTKLEPDNSIQIFNKESNYDAVTKLSDKPPKNNKNKSKKVDISENSRNIDPNISLDNSKMEIKENSLKHKDSNPDNPLLDVEFINNDGLSVKVRVNSSSNHTNSTKNSINMKPIEASTINTKSINNSILDESNENQIKNTNPNSSASLNLGYQCDNSSDNEEYNMSAFGTFHKAYEIYKRNRKNSMDKFKIPDESTSIESYYFSCNKKLISQKLFNTTTQIFPQKNKLKYNVCEQNELDTVSNNSNYNRNNLYVYTKPNNISDSKKDNYITIINDDNIKYRSSSESSLTIYPEWENYVEFKCKNASNNIYDDSYSIHVNNYYSNKSKKSKFKTYSPIKNNISKTIHISSDETGTASLNNKTNSNSYITYVNDINDVPMLHNETKNKCCLCQTDVSIVLTDLSYNNSTSNLSQILSNHSSISNDSLIIKPIYLNNYSENCVKKIKENNNVE